MYTVKVRPSELKSGDQILLDGIVSSIEEVYKDLYGYCLLFTGRVVFVDDSWLEDKIVDS